MVSLVKIWRRKCYFSEFILEQTRGFINKKSQSHQNQYCKNSQSHQSRFFKAHFVLQTLNVVSPLFSLFEFWDLFLFFILFLFFVFFGDLLPFSVPLSYPPSRMSCPV
jgi:type III secretory pathway component EscR